MEAPDIRTLKAAREQVERIMIDFEEARSQIGEAVDALRLMAGAYEAGGAPDGLPAGVRIVTDHIERAAADLGELIRRLESIDDAEGGGSQGGAP